MSMCISTAQARTNLTFPRHFIVILAEHCPCDMPMCLSTAQGLRKTAVRCWARAFSCKIALDMSICVSSAEVQCLGGARGILPEFGGNLAIFLSKRSLHDPVQAQKILWRFWWDPLWEVLAWRSCRCHLLEVLVWQLFWEGFLYQDLVRSAPAAGPLIYGDLVSFSGVLAWRSWSRSFTSPCEKFLRGSKWHAARGLCMTLYRSLWGAVEEVLVKSSRSLMVLTWSRTGPCEKILWRSCWVPPHEVLALRSWRCSALVLVWKFFFWMFKGSSCMKILWAPLYRSI